MPLLFNRTLLLVMLLLWRASSVIASIYYIATNGVDTNPGTINAPFATITRAQTAATSGDTVYLRGGTYFLNNANLTTTNAPWAIVNNITKSGVSYMAFSGEKPVFDFSDVLPTGYRVTGFLVTASDCVFNQTDPNSPTVPWKGTQWTVEQGNLDLAETKDAITVKVALGIDAKEGA